MDIYFMLRVWENLQGAHVRWYVLKIYNIASYYVRELLQWNHTNPTPSDPSKYAQLL